MVKSYIPPTRAQMNEGIMPRGKPPTLRQIREGATMPNKPFTIKDRYLINKWGVDIKSAKILEKQEKDKLIEDKISSLL